MKNLIKKLRNALYLVLRAVVQFQINNGMFAHQNCFERGQWLKYNWKAKVVIYSAIKDKLEPRQFDKYLYKYPDKNVQFDNEDSCSAFWVRRLYFWERKPNCP